MTDGKLAVVGLGSIGSMALWQASHLSDSVTGFEAASPAHGCSSVGGDTRLVRMIYRGNPDTETSDGVVVTSGGETVAEFFPGLFPNIVRSDAFPDLFTTDGHPLLGRFKEGSRIYCATGFSGAGRLQKRHRIRRNRRPRSPRQSILRGPGIRPAPTLQLTTARSPDFSFNY